MNAAGGNAWMAALSDRTRATAALAREASTSRDPLVLERLEVQLTALSAVAREAMQEHHRAAFEAVARKLESGHRIDDEDRRLLGLLLTGTAAAYLKSEDDEDAWRDDIRRVAGLLEAVDQDSPDAIVQYLKLQAAIEEANRVVPDLRFLLAEGERVRRFMESSETISDRDRPFLARLVRDMLGSIRR